VADDEARQHELIDLILSEQGGSLPGGLTEDEVSLAQTVALLKAANAEALCPDPAFVADLHRRLFGSAGGGTADNRGGAVAPAAPQLAVPPVQEDQPRHTNPLSRRRLLGALAGGAAAGLALGAAAGHAAADTEAAARVRRAEQQAEQRVANVISGEARPYHTPLIGTHGEWVTVAVADAVPLGGAQRFEAGALVGYLLRDSAGRFSAVSATCTHMGCLLTWQDSGRRLLCPCHGAAYDAEGTVVSGVARHPLPHIMVRVVGGEAQVWTVTSAAHGSGVSPYTTP